MLAAFCLTKSLSCKVVLFRDAVYFKVFISEKCFKMFKEDFVQIATQRSRIPSFCPDGSVMRPDAHLCLEDSQCSNVHPFECHGNISGHTSG
jgi:hypothetical protein